MTDLRTPRIAEQSPWSNPRSYRYDPFTSPDLRVRQLRLRVHPPLDWFGMACIALSVFVVGYFIAEFLR